MPLHRGMALSYINLSSDVYFVCVNHALSTEREEIVGLLVGEVDEKSAAHVLAVVILRRSDKRKDRVEISPEQLSNASTEAERLSFLLKRPIRIIGWYHSHPKLTVWPSPIDVNTQDSYQLMDAGFIGMIFSVFNEDPSKKGGRIQMTCFQSQTVVEEGNVEKKRLDVPVHLVPANHISNVCMKALIQLPRFLCQEEQLAYQIANQMELDYLTRLHNSSVYLRSMGQIAEVICGPLIKMLEERIINNEMKRKKLQSKKKETTMVYEQIQSENARSCSSRNIAFMDSMEQIECSQSSGMEQIECSQSSGMEQIECSQSSGMEQMECFQSSVMEEIEFSQSSGLEQIESSSDTDTNIENVDDNQSVTESFELGDILLENTPKQSVDEMQTEASEIIIDSPFCSVDELCISSTVETGNECLQANSPPASINSGSSFNQEIHVESSCNAKKGNLTLGSPPDSPHQST